MVQRGKLSAEKPRRVGFASPLRPWHFTRRLLLPVPATRRAQPRNPACSWKPTRRSRQEIDSWTAWCLRRPTKLESTRIRDTYFWLGARLPLSRSGPLPSAETRRYLVYECGISNETRIRERARSNERRE